MLHRGTVLLLAVTLLAAAASAADDPHDIIAPFDQTRCPESADHSGIHLPDSH